MARATLLLDIDTTPARSALGDLRGSARSAQASLTAEARKGERERERVIRDEARAAQRAAAEAARAHAKLERDSSSFNTSTRWLRPSITRLYCPGPVFTRSGFAPRIVHGAFGVGRSSTSCSLPAFTVA